MVIWCQRSHILKHREQLPVSVQNAHRLHVAAFVGYIILAFKLHGLGQMPRGGQRPHHIPKPGCMSYVNLTGNFLSVVHSSLTYIMLRLKFTCKGHWSCSNIIRISLPIGCVLYDFNRKNRILTIQGHSRSKVTSYYKPSYQLPPIIVH